MSEEDKKPQKKADKKPLNLKRDKKGKFIKGTDAPKSPGRPKGSISITTAIKRKLKEIPKGKRKSFLEILVDRIAKKAIVDEDNKMIKLIWNYIDGMPKQSLSLGADETVAGVDIKIISDKSEEDETKPSGDDGVQEELPSVQKGKEEDNS